MVTGAKRSTEYDNNSVELSVPYLKEKEVEEKFAPYYRITSIMCCHYGQILSAHQNLNQAGHNHGRQEHCAIMFLISKTSPIPKAARLP